MVAVGNYPTRTFTVTNYGNTTETPDVSTSDTHFQVTKNGCAPVAPGATCSLEVTFTAGSRGNFSAALYVGSKGSTTIKVNLAAASDTPDFLHSVFSVAFGTVSVGQTRKIGVDIINGNVPQTVNASIDGKRFSVAREGCDNIVAGGRCTLWVYYTPTSAGVDDTTLTITSSYGTTLTLPVTASGFVPAPPPPTPSVSVSPASFASTVLGLRSTTAITVTNTSPVPTQVSSATFDSPTMTVASLGTCVVAIQAGGRCTLTATFAPTVAGWITAHLKVAIPTDQVATVAATGTGVKAAPAVTVISPTTGKPAGGTAVTITGTNLQPATSVLFGATSVNATCTATKCTAISPAGTGTVHVRVVTPSGTSAAVTVDRFTYR